jgi:hypothetical protein
MGSQGDRAGVSPVVHILVYTLDTGLNVGSRLYFTAYNSLRKLPPPPRRLPSRIYSRFYLTVTPRNVNGKRLVNITHAKSLRPGQ